MSLQVSKIGSFKYLCAAYKVAISKITVNEWIRKSTIKNMKGSGREEGEGEGEGGRRRRRIGVEGDTPIIPIVTKP
jgi:hypothetical protein